MSPEAERTLALRSTWGTGYGSTRHLIGQVTTPDGVRSRCRSGAYRLDYFDADETKRYGNPLPQGTYVLRKKPCKTCAKLADAEGVTQ